MANAKIWAIAILILAAGLFFAQRAKSRYTSQEEAIFIGNTTEIQRVGIQKGGQAVELLKAGDDWRIAGNDSLEVRQDRIQDLLKKVLAVKRTTVMTENPERWATYSVDDSSGTHLRLFDRNDRSLGHFVFGESLSDWSRNYVRIDPRASVYLTDEGVIHELGTEATFWGEKPSQKPADSTRVGPREGRIRDEG